MSGLFPPLLPRRLAQVGALVAIWLVAAALARVAGLAISPGVIGLLALLALLLSGRARPDWIEDGAQWLLGELVLFFIPCVVAVMQYGALFRREGVQIVLAVALGTVLVMAATALAVHLGCRLEQWLQARREAR